MNAAEAKEMVAAANAHPKLVAQIVPLPMTLKYDKTIRNLIDSGALGQLLSIDVRGAGSAFMDTKAGMHWREDRDLSGNNIMAMGIFYEALMRWVGGATSVFAMGTVNVKERDGKAISIPDHVDILAAMACGAQARFQFSSVTGAESLVPIAPQPTPPPLPFQTVNKEGMLELFHSKKRVYFLLIIRCCQWL